MEFILNMYILTYTDETISEIVNELWT